jgi:hypothetical protein
MKKLSEFSESCTRGFYGTRSFLGQGALLQKCGCEQERAAASSAGADTTGSKGHKKINRRGEKIDRAEKKQQGFNAAPHCERRKLDADHLQYSTKPRFELEQRTIHSIGDFLFSLFCGGSGGGLRARLRLRTLLRSVGLGRFGFGRWLGLVGLASLIRLVGLLGFLARKKGF